MRIVTAPSIRRTATSRSMFTRSFSRADTSTPPRRPATTSHRPRRHAWSGLEASRSSRERSRPWELTAEVDLVFLGKAELDGGSISLSAYRHLEADEVLRCSPVATSCSAPATTGAPTGSCPRSPRGFAARGATLRCRRPRLSASPRSTCGRAESWTSPMKASLRGYRLRASGAQKQGGHHRRLLRLCVLRLSGRVSR